MMSEQKSKRTVRKYDAEFKRQALLMVGNGQTVSSVARALGVCESVLHRWKRENADKTVDFQNESDSQREIQELRSRLRQVEMERDILKKAVSIFSRQT
jgi:transposase